MTVRAFITYDLVTDASATACDVAERGYFEPGGWYHPQPPDCIGADALVFQNAHVLFVSEALRWALERTGSWHGSGGTYHFEGDPERDDDTGGEFSYALHLEGCSRGTLARIERLLKVRR